MAVRRGSATGRFSKGEDALKFISGDQGVFVDANGNALVVEPLSNLVSGPPILGFAERIGLAGTEATLPLCTFWATSSTQGLLMVRGDPVRNGTAWFRYGALQ
jgi:hypothetical protein